MKELVIALAVASNLALPAAVAMPPQIDVAALMRFSCSVMERDCTNIPVPQLREAPLFGQMGALGVFMSWYPDTIWIDNTILKYMDRDYVNSIVAHELTHYVDYQIDSAGMEENLCNTENNGWQVGNAYVVLHGKEYLADYAWQDRYGCAGKVTAY